jgi:formate/nitrite transporter FocA (FNT family)
VAAAFLLAIGPLNHAIVVSILMFTALHAGAPFGYADWLGMLGWITVGNIVGGLGLVTLLRLIQVGRAKIAEEQQRARPPDQQQAPTRR